KVAHYEGWNAYHAGILPNCGQWGFSARKAVLKARPMTDLHENLPDSQKLSEAIAEAPVNAAPPIPQGGLEVVSIAKSYDKRAVLADISLTVGKGEVVGLLGPNGAGKTTCFYSVMGLVRPHSGRILMDGLDVTTLPMYRRAILGLGHRT